MTQIWYIYSWSNNPKRKELKGRRCKILSVLGKNSVSVQFKNGTREVVSRRALRKEIVKTKNAFQSDSYQIRCYRELQSIALAGGLKWVRAKRNKKGFGVSVKSLREPGYTLTVPDDKVAKRFMRWFSWMKTQKSL